MPVGQLAELFLEIEIQFVDDAGIEANTRHQQEVPRRLAFELNEACAGSDGNSVEQLLGGAVGTAAQSDFTSENIRGARG